MEVIVNLVMLLGFSSEFKQVLLLNTKRFEIGTPNCLKAILTLHSVVKEKSACWKLFVKFSLSTNAIPQLQFCV